jgi:F0F1-type ATP synthase assembly protein I
VSQSTGWADGGTLLFSPRMQGTSGAYIDPAGAGGLLLAVLLVGVGVGLLLGWAAGATGIGAILGAIVGILAGILAVYRRYRGAF